MRTPTLRRPLRQRDQKPAELGEAAQPVDRELPVDDIRLQARWTGGPRLMTMAVTGVLWLALLTGPLALAVASVAILAAPTGTQPAAVSGPPDRSAEQAAVEEFAQRYVATWLSTPRDREQDLAQFVNIASVSLPEVAWTVTDATTATIEPTGARTWGVTVGVTLTGPNPVAADPGAAAAESAVLAVRRYFHVPVQYDAGALVGQALPSPVAAPPFGAADPLGYRYRVAIADPIATAAEEFLGALLTGAGDVVRYVSPGVSVSAIAPAPYTGVAVTSVLVAEDPSELPAVPLNGDQLHVLVTADVTAGPNQQMAVQYALTLAAREGRWEVAAVDLAPVTQPAATSTSIPTPTPGASITTSQPSSPPRSTGTSSP